MTWLFVITCGLWKIAFIFAIYKFGKREGPCPTRQSFRFIYEHWPEYWNHQIIILLMTSNVENIVIWLHFIIQNGGVIGNTPASFFTYPSFWPRQAGLFPLEFLGKNEVIFTLLNHSMYKKFHFEACSVMSTSRNERLDNMAAIMAVVSTLTSNFLLLISQKLQQIKLIHF